MYSIPFPEKLFWKKKLNFVGVNLMLDSFLLCFSKRRRLTTRSTTHKSVLAVLQRRETQKGLAHKWVCYKEQERWRYRFMGAFTWGYHYLNHLSGLSIVSGGDWLWNSANFRGSNNSAVSDVERTHHVTLTVHKFIQDGGQYKRSVSEGRRFWSHFGRFGRHWRGRGTICGHS